MLVLTLAGSSPLLLLLALVVGWFGPDVWLAREGRLRQERIERDLPDFLDILAVTVRAGLGYRAALGRVAEELGGPISEEMLTALRQMELGASRRQAFLALRERSTSESLPRSSPRSCRPRSWASRSRRRSTTSPRTCAGPRTRTPAARRRGRRRA